MSSAARSGSSLASAPDAPGVVPAATGRTTLGREHVKQHPPPFDDTTPETRITHEEVRHSCLVLLAVPLIMLSLVTVVMISVTVILGSIRLWQAYSSYEESDWVPRDEASTSQAPDEVVAVSEQAQVGSFGVTVSGMKCSERLSAVARNPDYPQSRGAQPYVDAEAPQGSVFCVVSSTWSNTSKEPESVLSGSPFAFVTTDGTRYVSMTDDTDYSITLTIEAGHDDLLLNPGDSAEMRSVVTVPEDAEIEHVVAEAPGYEEPEIWFATK